MAATYDIALTWEEPQELHELLQWIREQRPEANVRRIRYAYYVAEQAHSGQTRQSGEPYISHPLAVARILAELRMDDDTIVAGLLHDVLEDCPDASAVNLAEVFGESVVHLVEGVTKLKLGPQQTLTERQRAASETARAAESLRRLLLAMASDVRVMVIKLADRLHNMRTLDSMPSEKRIRIATETLDIYSPLAARLGIWQIKWQLEDLSFKYLHPKEFHEISELVSKTRGTREEELRVAILQVKERLEQRGLRNVEVSGRPKHLFSIFNKIVQHGFQFDEILDLLAMRVVVETNPDCYLALGIVHDLWMPIPNLFSDYIAKPKPNGYQSLHTKVVGPHGEPLEVQIRTKEMHQIAEYGVAAHWSYKEGATPANDSSRMFGHLREQLFDWSSDHRTSSDFLRSLSSDLFSEQVFVFTPKGDVIDLPKDSTPIDFAFRVHTNLGLTVVGSKVNGVLVPLPTKLQNGDVVELVTRSNAKPSLDWLEFVKSAHARSKLRGYFRKRNRDENAARGRDALERELKSQGVEPREFLGEDRLNLVAKGLQDTDSGTDLLAKVGEGLLSVQNIVSKLRGTVAAPLPSADTIQTSKTREGKVMLVTSGIDNVMLRRGRCCDPIPGDEVIGYVTRGRGIMIHRKMCPNLMQFQQVEPERLVPLSWPADGSAYSVNVKIVSVNRQGLLMDISTIFGESKTNVSSAKIKTLPNYTAEIEATIDVTDVSHLALVMTKIGNFSDVISILRLFGRTAK